MIGGTVLRAGIFVFLLVGIFCPIGDVAAQDVEPRRWSHLPMGGNFGGFGYAYTTADIGFDPVLLITDVEMEAHSVALRYVRPFKLLDKSARIDLFQAYTDATWMGAVNGMPASVRRSGFSDTTVRFAVNLIGAPPLEGKEFAEYRAKTKRETIVGVGLAVQLPTGHYVEEGLLNLGTNRFTIRPQLGVVRNCGKWSLEVTGSAWIFTDNDEFFDGNRREQDPIYSAQGHVVYTFKPGLWLAAGAAYGAGGESTINGDGKDDRKQNVAWGVSLGVPVSKRVGISFGYIGLRTLEDVGGDTDTLSVGCSVMW